MSELNRLAGYASDAVVIAPNAATDADAAHHLALCMWIVCSHIGSSVNMIVTDTDQRFELKLIKINNNITINVIGYRSNNKKTRKKNGDHSTLT